MLFTNMALGGFAKDLAVARFRWRYWRYFGIIPPVARTEERTGIFAGDP